MLNTPTSPTPTYIGHIARTHSTRPVKHNHDMGVENTRVCCNAVERATAGGGVKGTLEEKLARARARDLHNTLGAVDLPAHNPGAAAHRRVPQRKRSHVPPQPPHVVIVDGFRLCECCDTDNGEGEVWIARRSHVGVPRLPGKVKEPGWSIKGLDALVEQQHAVWINMPDLPACQHHMPW